MNKATQLWDIDRKRAFFRAFLQREKNLDSAAAEKLADTLANAVNMMRVWEVPDSAAPPPPATPAKPAERPAKGKTKSSPAEPAVAPSPVPVFDPFAFSPIVVLVKTGKDGLMKRLLDIKSVEHLKAFAEAQHLAVAPSIKKIDDLRKAIVAATEQRLADRKAAAS